MTGGEIKILVVDDHALVRSTLAERLGREKGFEVVGTAENADEAITIALECRPDIVLMDIDMPGLLCFEAADRMTSLRPDTHVIYLSAFYNDRFIAQALAAKASGYLTKSEPPEMVVQAIREVAAGGAYFSEEIQARIVVGPRGAKLAQEPKSRVSTLTPREIQILQYLARGLAKKQVARTLSISIKTVDRHTFNLMEKLDIHDRVELARYAIREGLAEA
jgi:DNA-binding NarL/FixJ family response regulator